MINISLHDCNFLTIFGLLIKCYHWEWKFKLHFFVIKMHIPYCNILIKKKCYCNYLLFVYSFVLHSNEMLSAYIGIHYCIAFATGWIILWRFLRRKTFFRSLRTTGWYKKLRNQWNRHTRLTIFSHNFLSLPLILTRCWQSHQKNK